MSFSEWINKKKATQEAQEEKRKSNTLSATGNTITFSEWIDNKVASRVDESYINNFISDASNFLKSAEKDYSSIKWDNASSVYNSKYTEWDNLNRRKKIINIWLNNNKDRIDEKFHNSLSEYLSNYDKAGISTINAFESVNEYYSQWETEDEYNDAVKVSELYDMSTEEITPHIESYNTAKEKIAALAEEKSNLKTMMQGYARGHLQNTPAYNNLAERIKQIDTEIDALKKSNIAHTTLGGQNITWQSLYDQKKQEEEFNSLYDELSAKEDWAEQSQYITTNKKGTARGNSAFDWDTDWYYEDVNKYSPFFSASGASRDFGYAQQTTDEEKAIFNYLYHTQGKEAAREWHESRKNIYKSRLEAEGIENAVKFAEDYPVFSDIVAVAGSVMSGGEYIADILTGNIGDTNQTAAVSSAIKDTRMEQIDWELGNWDAFDFLYGTGTSMAESVISTAMFGKYGGIALGLSAAAQGTNDALNRGMSKGQAFVSGLASGIFEGIFESWSIGAFGDLTKNLKRTDFRNVAKYIGKNMWNNAKEETLTEIANIAYDTLINGDFSQYETFIRQYMNEGMSESDAKKQVALDLGAQIAEAGASGALMGFGFGAGGSISRAYKNAKTGKTLKNKGEVGNLVDFGKSLGEGTESYDLANKINDKSSALAIGNLLGIVEDDVLSANRGDIVKSLERKGYDTKKANRIADLMLDPNNDMFARSRGVTSEGKTYNDIVNNPDSTVNQRTQTYLDIIDKLEGKETSQKDSAEASVPKSPTQANTPLPYSTEYIETMAKEYEAAGMSPEQAKIMAIAQLSESAEGKSLPAEENLVESKYEVSADGKTINTKNDEIVTIKKIESVSDDGEANLTLNDGTVVKASDLSFGSDAEAIFIENIGNIKVGKNPIGANSANALYHTAMNALKDKPNMTASEADSLIRGLIESYVYGTYNLGRSKLTTRDANGKAVLFAGELSQEHRQFAYELGTQDSVSKAEADQKVIDELVEKAKAKASNKSIGNIIFEKGADVDESALTKTQKANLDGIKLLAEISSIEFHVFRSDKVGNTFKYTMPDGTVTSANGWFVAGTNEIWIDLNAGNAGEGTMIRTAAHEISHYIKEKSPKQWKAMADLLMKSFAENNVDTERMLNRQIAKIKKRYKANKETLPSQPKLLDMAYEELVCDALSDMLTDGSIVNFIAEVKAKDANLAKRILNAIKSLLKKWGLIIDDYKDRDLDTPEAQALSQLEDTFKKLQEMYREAFMDANETVALVSDIASIDAESKSVAPMMSERTWTASEYVTEREKTAKAISSTLGVDIKTAYKYIDDINSVARLIADDRVRLDYDPNIDEDATVLKKNSEYKYSVDMSTLCAKRLLTTGTFDAIQRKLPNTVFTSEDIVALREMMLKRGYEVACGICYVESTRREMGRITQDFINSYIESQKTGKPIRRINSSGKAVDLKKTKDEMLTTADKSADKFYADKDYTPTLADLNTTDIDLVKKEHPLVYEAYLNFMNARGQAKPKLLETRAEYKGEILKHFKSSSAVKSRNDAGGLRLQSFSDFEVPHLIDMMQVIMDMSRVGLKSQAYTKVPAFAEVFGNTGVKINLSLIAKGSGLDANGNLIFDDVEGINHEEAFKLRDKFSKNVGTILVGKTDAHIIAAMADPRIDYIIPFHKSSWKESLYEALGLTGYADYTDFQNEKPIDKGRKIKNFDPSEYWDFTKSGDENAQIYLEKCRKDGRIPKFPQFQGYPGYWKLLIDFKMYDNDGVGSPQEVVNPTFEMDAANKILDEYKGGHRNFPVAKDVVEDFVNDYVNNVKFSERDSEGNTLTKEQIDFFKDSKVRDEDGNLLVMYHGTDNGGFTIFDPSKSDDKISLFLTASKEMAQTYAISSKEISLDGTNNQSGIYSVYANIANPYVVDAKGSNWNKIRTGLNPFSQSTRDIAQKAKRKGYDGVIIKNLVDAGGYSFMSGEKVAPDTVVIAFDSNQIKSVDNANPTSDPDIRYSERDKAYMDAVNNGDMKTAQRMVEEAARKAGYDSPLLYHGTQAFGFTKVKTSGVEKGAEWSPFFAASKEDISATYVPYGKAREISSSMDDDAISEARENAIEERKENITDLVGEFRRLIDIYFSEWVFGQTDNSHLEELVENANPEMGHGDGVYDVLSEIVYDCFYDYQDDFAEYEDAVDWEENSPEAKKIFSKILDIEGEKSALHRLELGEELGGIYEMYANLDNMYVVDGKGAAWNELRPEGLPKLERYGFKDVPYKTRDVAEWARDNGYDGVIFKNIRDNGAYGRTPAGDVYAFFKPESQVKSADPVTYDDNGNIVPLSERFNEDDNDIRYSDRDSEGKALSQEQIEFFKDSKVRDENGNLLVMYHGTDADFTEFNVDKDLFGELYYFAKSKTWVKNFFKEEKYHTPKKIMRVYLDIKKPLDLRSLPYTMTGNEWIDYFDSIGVPLSEEFRSIYSAPQKNMKTFGTGNIPAWWLIKYNGVGGKLRESLVAVGYDGLVIHDTIRGRTDNTAYVCFEKNQIKNITNKTPTTDPDIRYSDRDIKPITEAEYKELESHFGTTGNFRVAGYLLTDGKLLDFSGKHWGDTESRMRQVDHRDVQEVLDDRDNGFGAMVDMIGNGNIRLMPETGGICLAVYPNEKQRRVLSQYINYMLNTEGQIIIDYDAVGGDTVYSKEYGRTATSKQILNDIRNYFNGGRQSELMQFHTMYQERDPSTSNRSILAKALLSAAQNDIERNKLAQYKEKISLIEAEEQRLSKIQKQLFTKDAVEPAKRKELQFEAKQISNRINTYDRQLLNLEATTALKNVLNREKALAMKKQKQIDAEYLKQYKEKVQNDKKALVSKYQESRKKAVESRTKTAMRHKIKNVVNDLNNLLLKPSKERHVPEEMRIAVAEALALVNMDTVDADTRVAHYNGLIAKATDPDVIASLTETRDRILNQGNKLADKLTKLKDAYGMVRDSADDSLRSMYDDVIYNKIESVQKAVGKTPLRNMTLGQLESVYELYKMVLTTIRDSNKAFAENLTLTRQALGSNTFAEIKENNKVRDRIKHQFLEKSLWQNLKPMQAMKTIGSNTLQTLWNNILYGQEVFAQDYYEAVEFAKEMKDKHGYKKWNKDKLYSFESKSGKIMKLNLEQMMSIYAYSKRQQADEHIEYGGILLNESIIKEKNKLGKTVEIKVNDSTAYRLDRMQVGKIIETLEKEAPGAKNFVDEMQKYLSETMGNKGNEVSMKMYGVKLFKEEHYFPLKSSKDFMEAANAKLKGDVKIKNKGMTKSTVEHARTPIVLENFLDVWGNHINEMSMYHGLVLPLEDFSRTLNYSFKADDTLNTDAESVRTALHDAFGENADNYLNELLKAINGGVLHDSSAQFADKMISKFKKAKVMASLSVIVQQPTAIIRAMGIIEPKYFVAQNFNHKATWEELKTYCPTAIIKETGSFDTNMGRTIVDMIKDERGFTDKVGDFLGKAPAYMDEVGWNMIWRALKKKVATEQKLSGEELLKECGKQMTLIINETQVYDSVMSRNELMRSKNALTKMATAFMAEPSTVANMIYGATLDIKRGKKGIASKTIAATIGSVAINGLVSAMVYALRDDDEDETFLEKYLSSATTEVLDGLNPLTYIPFVKDAYSLFQGYKVERTDMALIKDVVEAIDDFYNVLDPEAYEGMSRKEIAQHIYDNSVPLLTSICDMFGLPVGNVLRDAEAIIINDNVPMSQTSSKAIGYAFEEGVLNTLPKIVQKVIGTDSKQDKLYDAIVDGDTAYVDRMKSGYKDEKAYEAAVRKALRDNDSRIREAAEARISGDIAEYARIVKEIKAEGFFSQDTIVASVNAEIGAINKGESSASKNSATENKESSIHTMDDYFASIVGGDQATAYVVKEDIIKTDVANGKDRDEAEDNFNSKFASHVREQYEDGYISDYDAEKMLVNYGGKSEQDAASKVQYWSFKQEYPDYDDLSEEAVDKYYNDVEPHGISIHVYYDYSKQRSKCKGTDKNGDGKTDSGSVKKEVLQVINSLPITKAQKDALYYINGWSSRTIYEAPWR